MHRVIGLDLSEALRMASLYPAQAARVDARYGRLLPGFRADIVSMDEGLNIRDVWIANQAVTGAAVAH
jgi:N-acetylglucosamine-6-phosphate deacetylase